MICFGRREGWPEEQTAIKAGYRGQGQMHQELEALGLPQWFVEGDRPPEFKQPASEESGKPRRRHRPKPFRVSTSLPPAEEAVGWLRSSIYGLSRTARHLQGREEWLDEGGRFGVALLRDGEHKHGRVDPYPPSPLWQLIAAFALIEGADSLAMCKLISKLHPSDPISPPEGHRYKGHLLPDPDEVDLEGLRKWVGKLRDAGRNVAKIVRGGAVPANRPPDGLSSAEAAAVNYVKESAAEGASLGEIVREVNSRLSPGPLGQQTALTKEEVARIIKAEF